MALFVWYLAAPKVDIVIRCHSESRMLAPGAEGWSHFLRQRPSLGRTRAAMKTVAFGRIVSAIEVDTIGIRR